MTTFETVARDRIRSRGVEGTKALYTADLERWLAHCRAAGVDPDHPTEAAATSFRDELVSQSDGEPLSDSTKRRILSALSKMYKTAVAKRAADWNPFDVDALDRPRPDTVSVTEEFTKVQVDALFAAAKAEESATGLRDLVVMRLLYDTGMRITSVVSLKREQIRRHDDGRCTLIVKVKKKGRVEVELPTSSIEALDSWLATAPESPWVFPSGRGRGALARRAISQRLTIYGRACKIKGAAPHRFRATYITEAFDAGLPLNEIQAAVHHSDPNSTQRYDRGVRGTGVAAAVANFRAGKESTRK